MNTFMYKKHFFKTYINEHLQIKKNPNPNLLIAVPVQSHTQVKSLTPAQLHRTIQKVSVDFGTSYYGNKQSI